MRMEVRGCHAGRCRACHRTTTKRVVCRRRPPTGRQGPGRDELEVGSALRFFKMKRYTAPGLDLTVGVVRCVVWGVLWW